MSMGRRRSGRAGPLLAAVAALVLAGQVQAQEVSAPLLTLDQERFFLESDFGRAAAERERAATDELEQENKALRDTIASSADSVKTAA